MSASKAPPPRSDLQVICAKCQTANPVGNAYCGSCGSSLESARVVQPVAPAPRTAKPPKKRSSTALWVIILIVIGISAVVFLCNYRPYGGGSGGTIRATSTPAMLSVQYRVIGTGVLADVTYENAQGGTEQKEIRVDWTERFSAKPGQFLYLSAQSGDDRAREITCQIWVDGKVWRTSTSSGRYVIASCSGSAGRD